MNLYKCHVLSFLESSTAAFYHAAPTRLGLVDHVQEVLLRELGLSEKDALLQYKLAPLRTRRDIAMLGLVHRAVLRVGPPQFFAWFPFAAPAGNRPVTRLQGLRHNKQLVDHCLGNFSAVLACSVLGFVRECNLLPQRVCGRVNCEVLSG